MCVCVCVSAPGLLWQLRPSDVEVELLAHTRNVVSKDLEEETGLHTGWIQNGGLFIASNKQRLDEYKRLMSVRTETRDRSDRTLKIFKKGGRFLKLLWAKMKNPAHCHLSNILLVTSQDTAH